MQTPYTRHVAALCENMGIVLRADAAQTAFFERQLESVEERLYEVDLRDLKHREYIPVNSSDDPGAETITYYLYSHVGAAKLIAAGATDVPRIDVFGQRNTAHVHTGAASYGFNTQELRSAAMARVPLDTMKVKAASREMSVLEAKMAWLGDTTKGIYGFITNPNIPIQQVPLGIGGSRLWANKATQEIVEDIEDLLNGIGTATFLKRKPTHLLLPIPQFQILTKRKYDDTNPSRTIMEWLLDPKNGFGLQVVDGIYELAGAGPGGTDAMMAYEKGNDVAEQRIPMPMTALAPQWKGLEVVTNLENRLAGTVVRYPLACRLAYGI